MSIHPQGEELRNAIKWISEERQSPKAAALKKLLEQYYLESVPMFFLFV